MLQRPEKQPDILDKRNNDPQRDIPLEHSDSAVPYHKPCGNGTDQFDQWVIDRKIQHSPDIGIPVLPVNIHMLTEFAALAVKKLNDVHTGNMLLYEGIQPGQMRAHILKSDTYAAFEGHGDINNKWQDSKNNTGEMPVDHEHQNDDKDQLKQIADNGYQATGKHLVECLDIVGRSRDEPTDRIAIVEADRKLLQMTKNVHSQVQHRSLADKLGEISSRILLDSIEKNDGKEHQTDSGQPPDITGDNIVVDCQFCHVWPQRAQNSPGNRHDNSCSKQTLEGHDIGEQPPDDIGIYRSFFSFSERVVLLLLKPSNTLSGITHINKGKSSLTLNESQRQSYLPPSIQASISSRNLPASDSALSRVSASV